MYVNHQLILSQNHENWSKIGYVLLSDDGGTRRGDDICRSCIERALFRPNGLLHQSVRSDHGIDDRTASARPSSYQRAIRGTFHVEQCLANQSLLATNSLVFLNSEPLVDFPKLTSARIIDIGGITVSSGHAPLNQVCTSKFHQPTIRGRLQTWSKILDLRPHTILLSFGTMAKSFAMPEEYKTTIRKTFRTFPNVTFIWKYEVG